MLWQNGHIGNCCVSTLPHPLSIHSYQREQIANWTDRHGRRGRSTAHILFPAVSLLSSTPSGSTTEGGLEADGTKEHTSTALTYDPFCPLSGVSLIESQSGKNRSIAGTLLDATPRVKRPFGHHKAADDWRRPHWTWLQAAESMREHMRNPTKLPYSEGKRRYASSLPCSFSASSSCQNGGLSQALGWGVIAHRIKRATLIR